MQILGLLGMNFDAVVVEVEKSSLFERHQPIYGTVVQKQKQL